MKGYKTKLFCALFAFQAMQAFSQTKPVDYLSVPGPIQFNGQQYQLSWTSNPSQGFYKQEYVVKGDSLRKYTSMFLMDVVKSKVKAATAMGSKLNELRQLKKNNPIVQFEVITDENSGTFMIDFILTANDASGKINIAERNITAIPS